MPINKTAYEYANSLYWRFRTREDCLVEDFGTKKLKLESILTFSKSNSIQLKFFQIVK